MDMNRFNYFLFLVLGMLLLGRPSEVQERPVVASNPITVLANKIQPQASPDAIAQRHIRQVIDSLPADSSLRRTLEEGHFGTGIHEPWMDEMKEEGVKLAMFEVRGVWTNSTHFRPQTTNRIIYRKKYDGSGSQVTDARELARFRGNGLEAKLQAAAFQKATKANWIGIDSPPKDGDACIVNIYLFDDEWLSDDKLSTGLPGIGRYNPEEFPLAYAAAVGDLLATRQQLAMQQFTDQQLNTALFQAVRYPSDNTDVISLLLKAGANVNAERLGGSTPLMDSVVPMNMANIRLLLNSGADLAKRARDGSTAYSRAMQQLKQFEESQITPPDYLSELLNLLKPPSTGTPST
jgi:hypothetical protein